MFTYRVSDGEGDGDDLSVQLPLWTIRNGRYKHLERDRALVCVCVCVCVKNQIKTGQLA